MSNLMLKNVNKIYESGIHAVKDFSMDIKDGEFIVLVGPSGCGKSTMLRMIAGLETISSGDMILGGTVINDFAPADINASMVFQNYALFGHLSVYDNMGITLEIQHENRDEIYSKVMKAANVVDLKRELNRKPNQLSGGQRQRVALGRSIVRDPELFLMDEPLSNLDAKLRAQTRKEIVTLNRKLKTTFIYVTHDQVEAMTMADRIVVMNNGYIQQVGTPSELYDNPANVFVGGFIGTPAMNFLYGSISQDKFVNEDFSITLPKEKLRELKDAKVNNVIMGIRPEAFAVSNPGENVINAKVDIVEYLGCEYVITFGVDSERYYTAKVEANSIKGEVHKNLSLSINVDKTYFFDTTSELRIV